MRDLFAIAKIYVLYTKDFKRWNSVPFGYGWQ